MSLNSALNAGVSGLMAHSSAMAVVADNISNVSTVGYKGAEADFSSMVTDGGVAGSYAAGGVRSAPRMTISKQGMLQVGTSQTDLGINGNGFFVTRSGTDADAPVSFTRAGAFRPDEDGNLRNTGGYYLQGWALDDNGEFLNTGGTNSLETVNITGLSGTASATTFLNAKINLQSTTPYHGGAPYVVGDLANGVKEPQFSRTFEVYDEQGNAHQLTMGFVKTSANMWQMEVYGDPAEINGSADGLLKSGQVIFNPDGSLDVASSDPALFTPINLTWANGAGSEPISLGLGSQDMTDGLTSYASASGLISSDSDGGLLGNLSSVEVSEDGIVSAIFEDGTAKAIYQLPVATFVNPDGLEPLNGNAYALSKDSGFAAINRPGELGGGSIAAGTLEASNVDLATEFTNMIKFQRAYGASSKIITTVDEMMQETSNMKR
ncbi:flagellar hook protein FlgE [Erythrobacter aureus]|uniref:flagellar hook protein FlgE n=1 Tax=Erythrobacter aureus TaxID=2182384 RepID=UPI0015A9C2B4|nr:flagellar hook protein FlgE [Erythrobacter aureus]